MVAVPTEDPAPESPRAVKRELRRRLRARRRELAARRDLLHDAERLCAHALAEVGWSAALLEPNDFALPELERAGARRVTIIEATRR